MICSSTNWWTISVMAFCSSVFSNRSVASAMRPRISAPRPLAAACTALCCLLVAAGCGGADEHNQAPVLVSFKRWAGSDPAQDDVVVRRDGTADLHLIHGGAGGHFRHRPAVPRRAS